MRKTVRLGIVGLVHDHVWGVLNQFVALGNAEVTCAADMNEPLLKRVKDIGVKRTYKRYEDLLADEKIDAVIVYTENSRAADVTEAAAEHGLHVMVEKPMAASLEQAQQMCRAAEKAEKRSRIALCPLVLLPFIRPGRACHVNATVCTA